MSGALSCHGLRLERGSSVHARRAILDGISVGFEPGRCSLIRGDTGVGKSSLLLVLAAMLRPDAGEVRDGEEVISRYTSPHRERWRRQLGIAFQEPLLMARMSSVENIALALLPRGHSTSQAQHQAERALRDFGVLELARAWPDQLSGGERQRVALARACAGQPRILLLDEPSAHQDADGVQRLLEAVHQALQRQAIVVVASHDPRLHIQLADADHRLLSDGQLESAPQVTDPLVSGQQELVP